MDEKLLELTEKVKLQEVEIEQLKKENETLQIECANKIADAKVEYEKREIQYKKKINELTAALELREVEETKKRTNNKSVKELWDDIL